MRGYYIVYNPLSEVNDSGVWKKIKAQIQTLNNAGLETTLLNCSCSKSNLFHKIQRKLNPCYFVNNISEEFFSGDFYFIRYSLSSIPFVGLLKKIRRYCKGKIIIEIPTYPYYGEFKGGLIQISLLIDKILSRQLKKYVDRIATYSAHKIIFNISAMQIVNGIDCSLIPVKRKTNRENNSLHFVAVAAFANWHGYDRLLEGLNNYYKQDLSINIYIHFVGVGPESEAYRNLVQEYDLSKYVVFHGLLFNEKLTEIFNMADIAICSLGCHRIGITMGSFLKSREYLSRGMPMISSTKIDILPGDYKYCLYVPEDESPIDIQSIVQFYCDLLNEENISEISLEIRRFAEKYCDISGTMKPVIDYLAKDL